MKHRPARCISSRIVPGPATKKRLQAIASDDPLGVRYASAPGQLGEVRATIMMAIADEAHGHIVECLF